MINLYNSNWIRNWVKRQIDNKYNHLYFYIYIYIKKNFVELIKSILIHIYIIMLNVMEKK